MGGDVQGRVERATKRWKGPGGYERSGRVEERQGEELKRDKECCRRPGRLEC